jgi:spore coat protein A
MVETGTAAAPKATLTGGTNFKFHPFLPSDTPTWGYYDGKSYIGYLGPTIEATVGKTIRVNWINNLPTYADTPFGWADLNLIPMNAQGIEGRAVVHVHGGHNRHEYDGGPEDWFAPGGHRVFEYENKQDEATMWYHDHAMGVTRLNAYAGLAGMYLLRGDYEKSLNLPNGAYEVPLILQDKAFTLDGGKVKLWYYKPYNPEFFGNVILVNAQMWPVFHVEPRRYRFRIYNATQARFFNLRLTTAAPTPNDGWGTSSDLPFYQIGAEGGFMPAVVKTGGGGSPDSLLLGNGERADVIVDFTNYGGREVYLSNDASTPYDPTTPLLAGDSAAPFTPDNGGFDPEPVINVMQFKVDKPLANKDKSFVPVNGMAINKKYSKLNPEKVPDNKWRQITLVEAPYGQDAFGNDINKVLVNNLPFGGSTAEAPVLGTTEVWQFVNMTPDWHPMHMHLVTFQVIGRQRLVMATGAPGKSPEYLNYVYGVDGQGSQVKFTGKLSTNSRYTTGPVEAPLRNESGFKDTVKCPNGWVTYVIAKFTDYIGDFVYHCHILDHEENDMMQYMHVQAFAKESAESDEKPTAYALDQNYPNPFNPATQIRFQMPQDGHAKLTIFNTAGQEVAKLVDGDLAAGAHVISWNANNVASGAYFYRLEAGAFSAVKSMLLLK